jgi:hypothetical protein
MPRRQAEVIEFESVPTKPQLCNILKIMIYGDYETVFSICLTYYSPDQSINRYGCKSGQNHHGQEAGTGY